LSYNIGYFIHHVAVEMGNNQPGEGAGSGYSHFNSMHFVRPGIQVIPFWIK
jgi:hypothetical protein